MASIALPESPVGIRTPAAPIKGSYSEKPSKSFFNRFRSSPPQYEKTHNISFSDGLNYRDQTYSPEDEDEVLFKPLKKVNSMSSRPRVKSVKSKAYIEDEEMERHEALTREIEETERLQRKHPNARVYLSQSKAAKEEEIERQEEEERQRREEWQRQEEMRQLDEQKKRAQMLHAARQSEIRQTAPTPLKSCLKNGSPAGSTGSYGSTPSPQSQYEFPSNAHIRPDLRRRDSTSYYSDTEQYRSSHRSTRRSQNYHAQHHHAGAYPPEPQYVPSHVHPGHRSRNSSFSGPGYPNTTPGQTPKYMKAYIKEVPLKDEAIALSWPLKDFETRRHARYPALFFDTGFDPRTPGFEIQVIRYGETSRSVIAREEETMLVSPHAFMTEMTLINERLAQWPVVVHNSRGIRCVDVFRAIYKAYSIVLTKSELMNWGQDYIDRCQRAFEQRCNDGPQLPPVTKARGLCRIDLLKGERIFKGITPLTGPNYPVNCWQLHFEQIHRHR
ncbi:hypothetical protein EST38_g467 [Candolleomyces aberdarensis]|uniref:DUF6699 domain-containing protein n=1 Tax=Candolleomyces aberdarensis TaxID=2316362 RepID=A0A4Q2DYJ6_9AGAR|nr:hypothetical protein EST38_g467 [Candolleomyces aberdarensis]